MKTRPLFACTSLLKKIFPALAACLFFSGISAQTSNSHHKENCSVQKFRIETIDLSAPADSFPLMNIHGITVIDARADTAHIGLMQKKVIDPVLGILNNAAKNQAEQRINKTPTFITVRGGFQQQSQEFMSQTVRYSTDTSLPSILMVVKRCWLSDELNIEIADPGRSRFAGPTSRDIWTSGIDIRIEFFLKDHSDYYPLYRYDSTITEPMTISEYGAGFITAGLQLSMQKLSGTLDRMAAIKSRRKFSMEDITRHNKDDFDLPALRDQSLKAGVYMSFEEFKNNQPSQTRFELKRDRLTDIMYITQPDGQDYVAREVWGYCDGANTYIKSAENFFLLQRFANAFYIFGAKNIKRLEKANTGVASYYAGNSGYAAPVRFISSKTYVLLEPFQLDWTSGKLY